LSKKIGNSNSNTMVFTKGSPLVAIIPEKIPEKKAPPIEWEDVVPEENFDWKVPTLPELPQGRSWRVVNPTNLEQHIVKKIWFSTDDYLNGGEITPPGTLYYSGILKYDLDFLKNLKWFSKGLDLGWKHSILYKGTRFYVDGGGAGGSSFEGLVKSNGFLIRSITINTLLRGDLEFYIYISDPVNMDEHIPLVNKKE